MPKHIRIENNPLLPPEPDKPEFTQLSLFGERINIILSDKLKKDEWFLCSREPEMYERAIPDKEF